LVVAHPHFEIGFIIDEVSAGVREEVVETVFGIFGLGFGVDPRIGRDLDAIAVDFSYFPPVVDIILLDSYDSRFNIITDGTLRKGTAPCRGEEEYGQKLFHNQLAAKIQKLHKHHLFFMNFQNSPLSIA
jgi:hypothetical protein